MFDGTWFRTNTAEMSVISKSYHGPLVRYIKLLVAYAPGMAGTFSPPPPVSDPYMPHGACVTHVPCCMSGSLTSGFLWSRCRGKRSRHSRRMSNRQWYASGKRPKQWYLLPLCLQTTQRVVLTCNNDKMTIKNGNTYMFSQPSLCPLLFVLIFIQHKRIAFAIISRLGECSVVEILSYEDTHLGII